MLVVNCSSDTVSKGRVDGPRFSLLIPHLPGWDRLWYWPYRHKSVANIITINYNWDTVYIFQCFHAIVETAIDFVLLYLLYLFQLEALTTNYYFICHVPAVMWQYPDPMQSGAAVIPGKIVPAHFSWMPDLGQGRARRGVIWAGGVWPERSPASLLQCRSCSRMLAFEIPWKKKVSHGTEAGLFLTDVLLVVGGLAPSHALPEGTGSQRKVLLSHEPNGWSLGTILSRGPCGSSWGGRWSGCAVAP